MLTLASVTRNEQRGAGVMCSDSSSQWALTATLSVTVRSWHAQPNLRPPGVRAAHSTACSGHRLNGASCQELVRCVCAMITARGHTC